jgi:hypothetical protein
MLAQPASYCRPGFESSRSTHLGVAAGIPRGLRMYRRMASLSGSFTPPQKPMFLSTTPTAAPRQLIADVHFRQSVVGEDRARVVEAERLFRFALQCHLRLAADRGREMRVTGVGGVDSRDRRNQRGQISVVLVLFPRRVVGWRVTVDATLESTTKVRQRVNGTNPLNGVRNGLVPSCLQSRSEDRCHARLGRQLCYR